MVVTDTGASTGRGDGDAADLGEARERALLAPYLPRLIVDWMAETPERQHAVVEGTVAFVDISGFTKLSERLAKQGKIGAEELAATIGTCFGDLLDLAYANGGRLLKFGGDALLLLFSGTDHEVRACRAVFDMRRRLRVVGRLTVLGQRVNLRMSVGVHSGPFDMFLVGGSHRELIVTGPAASTTVAMEAAATAGQILLSERTAAALAPSDLGPEVGVGRLLRRSPTGGGAQPTPTGPVPAGIDLAGCIPVALVASLLGTSREPEHRRVTVAFVHFDGTDSMIETRGAAATVQVLDRLVTETQQAVDSEGVSFLASDIDRDGGKLILVAGAPLASGEDEHRMLLAVRRIMDSGGRPPLRIGVNRGPVFAGDIGPHYRRTFTVMGDTVNLAARLMAKAEPGQILASPEVLSRSRSDFEVQRVEPFFVKGKARPVEALDVGRRLGGRGAEASANLPFVGRELELALWGQAVQEARRGVGSVIEIVAEPGTGKSRLLEEFRSAAEGMVVLSSRCDYYESSSPYGAVRPVLRSVLGLGSDAPSGPASERLHKVLVAHAPGLVPWAPLLGAVVDVDVSETPETSSLAPEFRTARLAEAVSELLSRFLPGPLTWLVEDAHWMDEASAELFGRLANDAASRPWVLCCTRRDQPTGFVAPDDLSARISLQPLGASEALVLAQAASAGAALPAHELSMLVARSGGNPLFLRELLAAARDGGDIDALPDSVEAVIAARIDRLAPDDRHFLRRLSVLGRTFPADLVGAVVDDVPDPSAAIWARLDDFVGVEGGNQLEFRHALLRDGAYDGLSYRLRRELHARAADAIVDGLDDRVAEQGGLLSYHYLNAGRHREALKYSVMAAERARAVFANGESAQLYSRALSAARGLGDLDDRELLSLHESLGDARYKASTYASAVTSYGAARRLAQGDPVGLARLLLKTARVMGRLDRYSGALRWISRGLRAVEGIDGREAATQRAQLLAWYARFSQESGRHRRALVWCERAVAEAERAGDTDALANALKVTDWALMDLGTLAEPDNWRRALELFAAIGDVASQSTLLNGLGMVAYFRGDWSEALDYYRESQQMAGRAGDSVLEAVEINNIAEIVLEQGRLDEAETLFIEAARSWQAAGYRSGEASVQCNLARVASGRGDYERAMALFDESLRGAQRVGGSVEALEAQARTAECMMVAGRAAEAVALADEALASGRALGGVRAQDPLLHRVRGAGLARLGSVPEAAQALRLSLIAAHERQAAHEVALTLSVMAELGLDHDGRDADSLEKESRSILAGLGVLRTPDLLGWRSSSDAAIAPVH
jgi:class 3 adenylate cyclase/tetratricopeptide (TPR) repeat protein